VSSGPEPPQPTDPADGLAIERTRLAWQRSGLSLVGAGLVIARGVPVRDGVAGRPAFGAFVLVLGLVAWGIGLRQERVRAKRIGTPREAAVLSDLAPVAIGTFLIGIAGLVVDLLFPR
jgi:uncharacterized membrane protein YidH (DUF202 family)